jgi:hypothetical protein
LHRVAGHVRDAGGSRRLADAAGRDEDEQRQQDHDGQASGLQHLIAQRRQQIEVERVVDEVRDLGNQHGRGDRAHQRGGRPQQGEPNHHRQGQVCAAEIAEQVLVIGAIRGHPLHAEPRERVVERPGRKLLLQAAQECKNEHQRQANAQGNRDSAFRRGRGFRCGH